MSTVLTLRQLTARYEALTQREKEVFLVEVAFWLSMLGRGTFDETKVKPKDIVLAHQINELIHRILGDLREAMDGQVERRPDDELIELIWLSYEELTYDPSTLAKFLP